MVDKNMDTYVSQEEINKQLDELEGSDRTLYGWMAMVVLIIAVAMSLFHLYSAGVGRWPRGKLNAIHLGYVLTLTMLIFAIKQKRRRTRIHGHEWTLALESATVVGYGVVA